MLDAPYGFVSRHSTAFDSDECRKALEVFHNGVLETETNPEKLKTCDTCREGTEKLTKDRRNLSVQPAPAEACQPVRWEGKTANDRRVLDYIFRKASHAAAKEYFLATLLNAAVDEHLTNTASLNWQNTVATVSIMWNEFKRSEDVATEMRNEASVARPSVEPCREMSPANRGTGDDSNLSAPLASALGADALAPLADVLTARARPTRARCKTDERRQSIEP